MIVVTGASGLIGGNLIRALIAQGKPVRALVHKDRRAIQDLDIEIVHGDILDPSSLQRAFKDAEIVFHLAGSISLSSKSWDLVEAINDTGVRNVVQACLQTGVKRLVHFSSIHAIKQEPLDAPLDETRHRLTDSQGSPYDRSKAHGEIEVRKGIEQGLDAVILNPTGIFGPYDFRPSFFGEALIHLANGDLPALVPGGFDWVDVRDVVAGAIKAAETAPTGESYLLSGHWRSVKDIAKVVSEVSGTPAPRLSLPTWVAYLGAPVMALQARITNQRPLYTSVSLEALKSNPHISHAKATQDLGYQPRLFRETIKDTLGWFTENGYIPPLREIK
jgi:dihydroflavonol-4-reductase